jgi:hypothetical protein
MALNQDDDNYKTHLLDNNTEWALGGIHESSKSRRKRIVVPISDLFTAIKDQQEEGGTHWSILIWDIEVHPNTPIDVKYSHFDSVNHSRNSMSAQVVARRLQEVCAYNF